MSDEMSAVMTAYLRNNNLEKFAISYHKPDSADFYCKTINSLKVEDGLKVFAKVIKADTEYRLHDFTKLPFDIFLMMDDRDIQKAFREIDAQDLAKALKSESEEVRDKIFGNMSKRASGMLKEDMEYMGPVRLKDVKDAQEKILDIVKNLVNVGEIVIARNEEGEIVK